MHSITVFLFAALVAQIACDKLDNTYLPPKSAQTAGGSGSFLSAPSFGSGQGRPSFGGQVRPSLGGQGRPSFGGQTGAYQQSGAYQQQSGAYQQQSGGFRSPNQDIPILKFVNNNDGLGNYEYSYETGNKIKAQETGHIDGEASSVQGGYSYVGDDGVEYTITYIADKDGFHAQGAHLPTPPPIPEAILRSIEQNEREAAQGIVDDGSYKSEYDGPAQYTQKASYNNNNNNNGYHY